MSHGQRHGDSEVSMSSRRSHSISSSVSGQLHDVHVQDVDQLEISDGGSDIRENKLAEKEFELEAKL